MMHSTKKQRLLAAVLMVLLALQMFSAPVLASDNETGTCGEGLTWSLNPNSGVLTITGTGTMTDYDFYSLRWNGREADIKSVVIHNGVTSIGAYAFYNCANLRSISIPRSVVRIGEGAFEICDNLADVNLPAALTRIAPFTFSGCYSLKRVELPNGLTVIDNSAFMDCDSLTQIQIPEGTVVIGGDAFRNCTSLSEAALPASVVSIGAGAFDGCGALSAVTYGGSEHDWAMVELWYDNDPMIDAARTCADKSVSKPLRDATYTLPSGIQNVPYMKSSLISLGVFPSGTAGLTISSGCLPEGLVLGADGTLSGLPKEGGLFAFTVTSGAIERFLILRVLTLRKDFDDVALNEEGYRFYAMERWDGTVHTYNVDNMEPSGLRDQFILCEGSFDKFSALYLDGKPLNAGSDYTAEPWTLEDLSGTKINIPAKTFESVSSGEHTIHTIAAIFGSGSEVRFTAQYFYILAGITFEIITNDADRTANFHANKNNGTGTVSTPNGLFKKNNTGASNSGPSRNGGNSSGGLFNQNAAPAAKQTVSYNTSWNAATSYAQSNETSLSDARFKVSSSSSASETFTADISTSAWYYENVNWAYQRGLMVGLSANSFAPEQNITMEQVLTVLYRISRALNNANPPILEVDWSVGVSEDQWYYTPVAWAMTAGIMREVKFTAGQPLTRGDMAMILYYWFRWHGAALPDGAGISFADESEMPANVASAFRSLKAVEIFQGDEKNKMDFTGLTSRAQFAALTQRICKAASSRIG